MLKCKICHQNDTDSTNGMCWECFNKQSGIPMTEELLLWETAKIYLKSKVKKNEEYPDTFSNILLKLRDEARAKANYGEDFGEFCIRTGHKLVGTQGVDGSKYNVNGKGEVSLKAN